MLKVHGILTRKLFEQYFFFGGRTDPYVRRKEEAISERCLEKKSGMKFLSGTWGI